MNTRNLEYFVAVAELGSINKAAQTLFVSQPHLGKIIKDMEDDLGVLLFQRTRHGVVLTPDGEEFLNHVHRILHEMEQLQQRYQRKSGAAPSLSVSMTKYSHIMESFIDVTLRHKDDLTFSHQLNEGSPEDVIKDLIAGQAHIGVLDFDGRRHDRMVASLQSKGLSYHFLTYIRPHIIISKQHPLVLNNSPINLHTLTDYGFVRYIGQCEDFVYRITAQHDECNLNQSPKIIYLYGRASLLHLISASDFYSIGIHDFSSQYATYHVLSVPIEDCDELLEFGYILPQGAEPTALTLEFIENLKKRFEALES